VTGGDNFDKVINPVRKNTIRELNDYLDDKVVAIPPFHHTLQSTLKPKKLRNSVNTTSMKGVLMRNNLTTSNSSIKRYSIHVN